MPPTITENPVAEAAAETAVAASTFSLPNGVNPVAVQRRLDALIANGTDPFLARQIAVEAETLQSKRDDAVFSAKVRASVEKEEAVKAALESMDDEPPAKKPAKK